jgi:hypothetical protein
MTTMRYLLVALSLLIFVAPVSASLQIVSPTLLQDPIPDNNDFKYTNLNPMGLYRIVLGDVKVNGNGVLNFVAYASESGFTNSFKVASYTFTENPDINPWYGPGYLINSSPIPVTDGMLLSDAALNARFTTTGSGGLDAAIKDDGFGIFVGQSIESSYTTLYFGYDDNGAGPDDNHDDLIVSVTFTPDSLTGTSPVPEPISFLVWGGLAGVVGLVSSVVRRR